MDLDFLGRLKVRDSRAQREFRMRFLPALVLACERALRDRTQAREVAEDVVTDVLLIHIDKVRAESSLAAYLRMIAIRRCGRLKAFLERHDELGEHRDESDGPEAALVQADETHRWRERIGGCLKTLRPRARAVLRMRFHLDATQETIGNVLGVSKQYVGKVIAKALESLRMCLEAHHE